MSTDIKAASEHSYTIATYGLEGTPTEEAHNIYHDSERGPSSSMDLAISTRTLQVHAKRTCDDPHGYHLQEQVQGDHEYADFSMFFFQGTSLYTGFSEQTHLISIPGSRDAPCGETDCRYFGFKRFLSSKRIIFTYSHQSIMF
ncbi:hypothetical protein BDU57DRAFT_315354 [Ampelomyces quisqualis]|uniref:Uncharacterized protein n=1 Tax=Ampelomyces quisqualis TaxID=50730 RepID=A0A6A5QGD4_AMPQU|nr:hypothetical protein BDU57DRAFT_315354 [Ampelomyces quisqualis]